MALTVGGDVFGDPFFSAFFGDASGGGGRRSDGRLPRIDLVEREKDYLLLADVPGVPKDKIKLDVDDDVLTINVESDEKGAEEGILTTGAKALRQERNTKYASRSIRFPRQADLSNIKASYDNGVLKLIIPKKQEAQPRQINIQ